jgi:hypothetical protein
MGRLDPTLLDIFEGIKLITEERNVLVQEITCSFNLLSLQHLGGDELKGVFFDFE